MDIISVLQYFGITPASLTPLIVIGGIGLWLVYKHTKPIRESVDAIKSNVTTVISHLATSNPSAFPASILKAMSPYQIQPDGYKILKDSGFDSVLNDQSSRKQIFGCLEKQGNKTKYDIEKNSIVCYSIILNEEFMNPIKSYLFNNPQHQQVFPTLAGIYIRDEYLKEHPEVLE